MGITSKDNDYIHSFLTMYSAILNKVGQMSVTPICNVCIHCFVTINSAILNEVRQMSITPKDIVCIRCFVTIYSAILNEEGQVSITPIDKDAPTFVNGQQITHSVALQHVSIAQCNNYYNIIMLYNNLVVYFLQGLNRNI